MNENEIKTESSPEEEGTPPIAEQSEIGEPAVPSGETTPSETEETPSDSDGAANPEDGRTTDDPVYRQMAEDDLAELKRIDPAAADYRHLGEMPGALRFAELRGLGLSVSEAYYAVRGANAEKPSPDRGGRAHLHGSVPGRAAASGVGMTVGEIESARRLFPGLSDREIATLWRRVNEN